ncbi:cobaltochelatase subunit CobN [Methanothermobacter sp. KEPCO 2]|uniref:cobaltochelatase subunit CobN n=1 Tax=Methanothermobacter sp. KEPCO 2 TaxID=3240977 RepID=UPI003514D694
MKNMLITLVILLFVLAAVGSVNATNITENGTAHNISMDNQNSKMLKPAKVVVLATRLQAVEPMKNAYRELLNDGYNFELKIFTSDDVAANSSIRENFGKEIRNADILYMFHVNNPLTSQISPLIRNMKNGSSIFQTSCSGVFEGCNVINFGYSSVFSSDLSKENLRRVLLELLRRTGHINISANETQIIPLPKDFVYHPDISSVFTTRNDYINWYCSSGHYKTNGPWIGLIFHAWYYTGNDLEVYNKLIRELEVRGANVIAVASEGSGSRANATLKFFTETGNTSVDCIIAHLHASYASDLNSTLNLLEKLDVPVLNPVHTSMLLEEYLKNAYGLSSELSSWVITPETEGRIEPILIGGSKVSSADPLTGAIVKTFTPYEPGVRQLAERAISWANLRRKPNNEKKIALVYIDNTHDETMPSAAGLNLPSSLANILNRLLTEGYSLPDTKFTNETVLALMNSHGRNIINPTQEDLRKLIERGAITVDRNTYLKWYQQLPQHLRNQVESVWGPPPGNIMVYNNRIVLPGIILGNILVAPQPVWKWSGTINSILNNETLPPTHQYIAFYLWLQKYFKADAYIQLGTHGTLELLPGHSAGMTDEDWPNTLIGAMPHIYIRNIAGEDSTAAKRRSYAVIITHLTPPIVEAGLYGDYVLLKDLISSYESSMNNNDTNRADILKSEILNTAKKTGLIDRLGMTASTTFEMLLEALEKYIVTLEKTLASSGLHTFGESPHGDILERFVSAIISFDPQNRTAMRESIKSAILSSGQAEMNSLIKALNGGYIKPVPLGDPIRSPDTLPTGRNVYSFDPRRVPDAVAMKIGSNATEEMLRRYKESNNGKYPETVAIDVRGGEIMQTNGQSIASILYLLGLKPIYNQGILVGTEVIPLQELGRPRIDVLIQASVSFRDLCPHVIGIIDDGIRKIALLDEPSEMNYVRKHYLSVFTEIKTELLKTGINPSKADEQANILAGSRIFGLPPGADPHGVGVGRLMRMNTEWTDKELAETFLEYNSYIYGNGINGLAGRSIFEKLIRTVDTTMTITPRVTAGLPTPLYAGSGVMNFVVRYLTGKSITSYIIRTGDGIPKVLTMREAVYDDLAATLFNPEWKNSLLREGYSGRATIALRIRGLLSTDALVDVIDSKTWREIMETYFSNKDVWNQFSKDQQKMIANVLYQAYSRGMLHLTASEASFIAKTAGVTPCSDSTIPEENQDKPGKPNNADLSSSVEDADHSNTNSQPGKSPLEVSAGSSKISEVSSPRAYEINKEHSSIARNDDSALVGALGLTSFIVLVATGYFLGVRRKL